MRNEEAWTKWQDTLKYLMKWKSKF